MNAPSLPVIVSPTAQSELQSIWRYNVGRNGLSRADRYDDFLRNGIDKLATNHKLGTAVEARPDLRYVILKRRSKGDGHVVVFRISKAIDVLHVFHTKQDWQNKL